MKPNHRTKGFLNDLSQFARDYLARWLFWAGLAPLLVDFVATYLEVPLPNWFGVGARIWLIITAFYAAFAVWRGAHKGDKRGESSNQNRSGEITSLVQPTFGAIPAPPGMLIGRDEIKRAIHEKISAGQNVSLHGMGGIGKTSVAASIAWERAKAGETVFWLKAERRTPDALYDEVARRLGDHSVVHLGLEEKRTRVRELINQFSIHLFVLDDVWDAEAARALENAQPAGCTLLITGRERAGAGSPFDVAQLSEGDSEALFRYHAGLARRTADVKSVIALLSGHPMALEIAGKILYRKDLRPSELVKQLNKIGYRVKVLSLGNQATENVWASLLLSVDALPKLPKMLFKKFGGLWSTSITSEMVALIANLNSQVVDEALSALITASLIRPESTVDGIRRYRLHDLIYDIAVGMFTENNSVRDQKLLLDACCRYAKNHADRSRNAHDRLEAERENLLGASEWGFRTNHFQQVNELAHYLWTDSEFLRLRGFVLEAEAVLKRGVHAAESLHKSKDKVRQLIGLGIVYRQLGEQSKAAKCLQLGLNLARKIKDPLIESKAVGDLGWVHYRLGNVDQAITYLEEALAAVRIAGDIKWEGVLLGTFGRLYTDLGEMDKALDYLYQALNIANEIKDEREAERHIGSLGIIYRLRGQIDEANSHLTRSLRLAREIGDLRGEGRNLGHLGLLEWSKGNIDISLDLLKGALTTHRKAGDPRREGYRLKDLAQIYLDLGQLDQAREHLQRASDIAEKISDFRGTAEILVVWGKLFRITDRTDKAVETFQNALEMHRKVRNRRAESDTLLELGLSSFGRNDWQQAEEYYRQALKIAQLSGDLEIEGFCVGNIGALRIASDEIPLAESLINQAMLLHQRGSIKRGIAIWQKHLGKVMELRAALCDNAERELQFLQQAATYYERSYQLYHDILHIDAKAVSLQLQEIHQKVFLLINNNDA